MQGELMEMVSQDESMLTIVSSGTEIVLEGHHTRDGHAHYHVIAFGNRLPSRECSQPECDQAARRNLVEVEGIRLG
jgi:hypothetical protein